MIPCEDRRAVRCHKDRHRHIPVTAGTATSLIPQQAFKEYRLHKGHTDKSTPSLAQPGLPHLSPAVITLVAPPGPWYTYLNPLPDVSLPLCSHTRHQPRAEPPWPHLIVPQCLLEHKPPPWRWQDSPLVAPSAATLPTLPALWIPVTRLVLATPEEERWIDCYQSSRRLPSGRAAQAFGFGARSSYF